MKKEIMAIIPTEVKTQIYKFPHGLFVIKDRFFRFGKHLFKEQEI